MPSVPILIPGLPLPSEAVKVGGREGGGGEGVEEGRGEAGTNQGIFRLLCKI